MDFYFDDTRRFVITDYSNRPPFASFLPGIAGPMGIPLWVFYVNRGQGIASFGIGSKDSPIIEFQPANKAYQTTPFTGFRTFVRRGDGSQVYEPFSPCASVGIERRMAIGPNELEFEEIAPEYDLKVSVLYYTLTNQPLAGLVRTLTITNLSNAPVDLSVLDGLPAIIPYGVNNTILKEISRTAEAWMEVFNLENHIPFYRVRASIADTVEVQGYTAGHFYMAFSDSTPLPALVDPHLVFGPDTTLSFPVGFSRHSLQDLYQSQQITVGKTPCGFFGTAQHLGSGDSMTFYAVIGHASDVEIINREGTRLCDPEFIVGQRIMANSLIHNLTDAVAIKTSSLLLDEYTRQCLLDNVMRGGWPVLLGDSVYHIYSRKHGDLERDYNAFYLAPEFYSQGNGSYRDVNQNRREDVWLNPDVGDFNILTFMNLIQADGYNPLVIQGSRFYISPDKRSAVFALVDNPSSLEEVLSRPFTPGELLKLITVRQIGLRVSMDEFLATTLQQAEQRFEAAFGEGYWIDHWTYNLDLIENYLAIYPERYHELLFGKPIFTFYDSPVVVRPRSEKYKLVGGQVRQLHAVAEDAEKAALIAARADLPHLMRLAHGRGGIYSTTLFVKLICLALTKFATMDPLGMGIEMEAGRPGWYDALNGLPGLFGSSMPETFELSRLLEFLRKATASHEGGSVELPIEVYKLLESVQSSLEAYNNSQQPDRDHLYWDMISTARETYRQRTRLGFKGDMTPVPLADLERILKLFSDKVQAGVQRALALNDGIPPTYFSYRVDEYDINGSFVRVKRFVPVVLPLFLEGPVRALKIMGDREQAQQLHQQVKASLLYDQRLKMYKVNASLETQPPDIGRTRAFTPGWLENESIWLHMEYKYLVALLKAGLYEAFYEDFQNVLIPFQDPATYGRSPVENSSFIVSSAHPDPSLHGRGFVARLSGSTVEYLSLLHLMMVGETPFSVQDGQLCLAFKPRLAAWLFDAKQTVTFTFLGCIIVTYHNPQGKNTFGEDAVSPCYYVLETLDGSIIQIEGASISAPFAALVRSRGVKTIHIELG